MLVSCNSKSGRSRKKCHTSGARVVGIVPVHVATGAAAIGSVVPAAKAGTRG